MNANQSVIENQNIIANLITNCKEMAGRLNIPVEEAINRKVAAYIKYAKSDTEIVAWEIRQEEALKTLSTESSTNVVENIRINRTSSYGRYTVTGTVNGTEVSAPTTDSEAFDYLNDEDFPEKQQDALEHCKMVLEIAYEGL